MKRTSTVSQNVRIFVTVAVLAAGAMGCGAGSDSTGAGGSGGGGGSGGSGAPCDAMPIFTKHTCALATACHDAAGSAAHFNMETAGWQNNLVGKGPVGGSPTNDATLDSKCSAVSVPPVTGKMYLNAGSNPATGLFLDKLFQTPPPCGAKMPNLGAALNATELACVQSWANALTAAH